MKTTLLKVITPDEVVYDGQIRMVTIKTVSGYRGILPNHAPLVSMLGIGQMRIHDQNGKITEYNISNGLLIVQSKSVKILTDNISKT